MKFYIVFPYMIDIEMLGTISWKIFNIGMFENFIWMCRRIYVKFTCTIRWAVVETETHTRWIRAARLTHRQGHTVHDIRHIRVGKCVTCVSYICTAVFFTNWNKHSGENKIERSSESVKKSQQVKIENVAGSVWFSLIMDGNGKCKIPSTPL
jgi:hypothetical protein